MNIREDDAGEVKRSEQLDLAVLNAYLSGVSKDLPQIKSYKQFPGGYSNLTYLLETTGGEFVLRRPPIGAQIKSAHDMGREFNVLSLIRPAYPLVPEPVHYCASVDIIGAPFYLMKRIHGVILRAPMANTLSIQPTEMRSIANALIDNLARLHSIDIHNTGLIQLGKPEGYVARQVEGWVKRYRTAETDVLAEMNSIADWLVTHMPVEQSPTLLHNDYKYDNVVLDGDSLTTIRGVLDWEMATVGDPWMDVGATLAYWSEAGDHPATRSFNLSWLPGNPTRKEVLERYESTSGRHTDNVLFYFVFGLFKNAVIAQQIYARWKQGHSEDPRFGSLIHVVRQLGIQAAKSLDTNHI